MARKLDVSPRPGSFGEVLRMLREGEGATLSAFARKLGMSAGNLCDLEQGRKLVGPKRARVIAQCLNYPLKDLLAISFETLLSRENMAFSVSVSPRVEPSAPPKRQRKVVK